MRGNVILACVGFFGPRSPGLTIFDTDRCSYVAQDPKCAGLNPSSGNTLPDTFVQSAQTHICGVHHPLPPKPPQPAARTIKSTGAPTSSSNIFYQILACSSSPLPSALPSGKKLKCRRCTVTQRLNQLQGTNANCGLKTALLNHGTKTLSFSRHDDQELTFKCTSQTR